MTVNNRCFKIPFIISLLFLSSILLGQDVAFKKSNFKDNKEALKAAKNSISIADDLRKVGIEKILSMQDADVIFLQAIFHYNDAHLFNPNNAELNYKIGSCWLFTNQKQKAYDFLIRAQELNSNLPAEFHFYLGMALQLNKDYSGAINQFTEFTNSAKGKVYSIYEVLTKKYIKDSKNIKNTSNSNNRVWIDNLLINTKFDDWSPCLSADGELLIFSSNMPNSHNPDKFNMYDQDIYYSELSGRNFKSSLPISEINTDGDDVSGALAYDGQRLLIFKDEDGNSDVYESLLDGKSWGVPKRKMGDKLRGGNSEGNESFSSYDPPDVKVYYITDGGYGNNKNIYFSGVMNKERNLWGKGQSAGHELNTKFEEGSVYIHPDGRTMYFSSKGHNTLGGYDIYVSYVDDLGHWGEPINLGYPINSAYDDLFYSATASGKYAYIASNRKGGKGGLDIYKITYCGPDKPMNTDFQDQLIASIAKPVSDNSIANPIVVDEKSLTVFKGKVLDAITKEPIKAAIEIILNKTGETYTSFYSNSATGKFLLSLPAGSDYGISVAVEGYLFHSENFNLPKGDGFNSVTKNIELKNIEVGNNITLRNVFFDSGRWAVKPDSYTELDRLIKLLIEVPSLKIEISGHTDNVGAESFNELLSQRRADAVVQFLVGRGIDENRLSAKGYGQNIPIETNENPKGRALNRRTEFKIVDN